MINKEDFDIMLKNKGFESIEEFRVKNAVIMAAGLSKRFHPIGEYRPKALCRFKGEVLIERQIRQLKEIGITDIYVVVGYKKEMFYYLKDLYGVNIIENNDYLERNNTGSLFLVKDILSNTYICSCDNYFAENVFTAYNYKGYYSCIFNSGKTDEWCISCKNNIISDIKIGGKNSYIMLGHAYFDQNFSKKFVEYLVNEYEQEDVKNNLWEYLYMKHLDELELEMKVYDENIILEFDTVQDALLYDKDFLLMNKT